MDWMYFFEHLLPMAGLSYRYGSEDRAECSTITFMLQAPDTALQPGFRGAKSMSVTMRKGLQLKLKKYS